MYEGKNIHYSAVDQKPLCSFSTRLCRQRRLNGYAFCVRHILEDPSAPYKPCTFVNEQRRDSCNNPVPNIDTRPFCNSHMQMSGLMPKPPPKVRQKEPKVKDIKVRIRGQDIKVKDAHTKQPRVKEKEVKLKDIFDNRMTLEDRLKSKFNLHRRKENGPSHLDPDDPYAFPDPVMESTKLSLPVCLPIQLSPQASPRTPLPPQTPPPPAPAPDTNHIHMKPTENGNSMCTSAPMLAPPAVLPVNCSTSSVSCVTGSASTASTPLSLPTTIPIAKLYPELAEKLEKARVKPELIEKLDKTRVKPEVKLKPELMKPKTPLSSSRTMNRLQNKIAQKKIKDKLKKTQVGPGEERTIDVEDCGNGQVIGDQGAQLMSAALQSGSTTPAVPSVLQSALTAELPKPTLENEVIAPKTNKLPNSNLWSAAFAGHSVSVSASTAPRAATLLNMSHSLASALSVVPSHISVPWTPPCTSLSATLSSPSLSKTVTSSATAVHKPAVLSPTVQQSGLPPPSQPVVHQPPLHPPPPYPSSSLPASVPVTPPALVTSATTVATVTQSHPAVKLTKNSKISKLSAAQAASAPVTAVSTTPSSSHSSLSALMPPPPPAVTRALPPPYPTDVSSTHVKPCLTQMPSEASLRRKLRRHSAVKLYKDILDRRLFNIDLIPTGIDSSSDDSESEDELPWQREWYITSPDDRFKEPDEIIAYPTRTTKLSLLRSRIRRQLMQLRRAQRTNVSLRQSQLDILRSLITAAKNSPLSAAQVLRETKSDDGKIDKMETEMGLRQHRCTYKLGDKSQCTDQALPYTNHCVNHIMDNVEQKLFDYCTAKFSDNTQCCVPVFDIRHELPLCPEHAAKADNYNKNPEPRPKKPRKKTKPSALTRPPRKGKKKRNQKRTIRPQKPMPPLEPSGQTELPDSLSLSMEGADPKSETEPQSESDSQMHADLTSGEDDANTDAEMKDIAQNIQKTMEASMTNLGDDVSELESTLPPDIEKSLDLPIDTDQAAQFLDEHELREVFNRLPEEAFDIFTGKNGEFEPSGEDMKQLELALAQASADVNYANETLEQFKLSSTASMLMNENSNDDELTKQIADSILNQPLGSPTMLDADMPDDLNPDNLHDLANISTADLKNISQTLNTSVPNNVIGPDTHNLQNVMLQGATAMLNSGQLGGLQGHLQGTTPISVIQQQLAPLTTQFHIQMPGTITTLDGTAFTISPQGALIPTVRDNSQAVLQGLLSSNKAMQPVTLPQTAATLNGSSHASLLPQFSSNILAPNLTLQEIPDQGQAQSQSQRLIGQWASQPVQVSQSQMDAFQGQPNPTSSGPFNLMQTATFTAQGLQHTGIKFAYPLQNLLPTTHGEIPSELTQVTASLPVIASSSVIDQGQNSAAIPSQLITSATANFSTSQLQQQQQQQPPQQQQSEPRT